MTPEFTALIGIGLASITLGLSFSVVLWKIACKLTKMEMYSRQHAEGIEGVNTRLDVMNGYVREHGEKIARLEGGDN